MEAAQKKSQIITQLQSFPLKSTTRYNSSSADCPLGERTVGVVSRNDGKCAPGYNLFSKGKETYLIDNDGRVVHSWRSLRVVFCAYLLEDGSLLRDGSDNIEAKQHFSAGGAAGYVELVSWENETIWSWSARPSRLFLTHHDLEPLPKTGGCLVMCWQRRTKAEAIAVGRSPELLPDNEMWDDHVIELRPNGKGGADVVWTWKLWDHLCQDVSPDFPNYVACPSEARHRFDVNRCPAGGKQGCRNRNTIGSQGGGNPHSPPGKTGEKDWVHGNALSYNDEFDLVLISFNVPSEIVVVKRESGDIVWRWGSPVNYAGGTRFDQTLFCQHAPHFIAGGNDDDEDGDAPLRILLFNNGRIPDRHWSSVDEIVLPGLSRSLMESPPSPAATRSDRVATDAKLVWTFGPPSGRSGSFYCTHISSVQRLGSNNTLVTMGPQGIVFEVTPEGEEVFRYVSPALTSEGGSEVIEGFVRQGEQRPVAQGKFSLFSFRRYPESFPAFIGKDLVPGRHLEG